MEEENAKPEPLTLNGLRAFTRRATGDTAIVVERNGYTTNVVDVYAEHRSEGDKLVLVTE